MFKNRLEKNIKKLRPWAERAQIEAFRIYDRDIPEYPYIVDIYKNFFLVHDKSDLILDRDKNHLDHVLQALQILFKCSNDQIVIKKRERQDGLKQYEKLDEKKQILIVRETQALFKINLYDYLDTGLFLDHRPMRQKIYKTANGTKFLNLFCYTGSVSVFAALGGAQTVSVDMSQTYLRWAQENFELNKIDLAQHRFINSNVINWLETNKNKREYDLIFLDPPTFSNSKKMEENFDVERDQEFLVNKCMSMLNSNGILYFSNNKRKFKLSESIRSNYQVKDISEESIPQDFHDKKIHNCFQISALSH
jgi:23S rRNA (cytosine1962-C5)-methyltransferase/23S rRNA (guanine2445-N2)-methyltransferase / 23S rRNA (guanine2069-N7)-methyltransferase